MARNGSYSTCPNCRVRIGKTLDELCPNFAFIACIGSPIVANAPLASGEESSLCPRVEMSVPVAVEKLSPSEACLEGTKKVIFDMLLDISHRKNVLQTKMDNEESKSSEISNASTRASLLEIWDLDSQLQGKDISESSREAIQKSLLSEVTFYSVTLKESFTYKADIEHTVALNNLQKNHEVIGSESYLLKSQILCKKCAQAEEKTKLTKSTELTKLTRVRDGNNLNSNFTPKSIHRVTFMKENDGQEKEAQERSSEHSSEHSFEIEYSFDLLSLRTKRSEIRETLGWELNKASREYYTSLLTLEHHYMFPKIDGELNTWKKLKNKIKRYRFYLSKW